MDEECTRHPERQHVGGRIARRRVEYDLADDARFPGISSLAINSLDYPDQAGEPRKPQFSDRLIVEAASLRAL